MLITLKRTQLLLAIAISISVAVVFFPSLEVILFLPFCLLYVTWAIRAIGDRRLSRWLACITSLIIALLLSTLAVTNELFTSASVERVEIPSSWVVVDPGGELRVIDRLPTSGLEASQKRSDSQIWWQRIYKVLFLLGLASAWTVVVLHAYQWRWLVSGKTVHSS